MEMSNSISSLVRISKWDILGAGSKSTEDMDVADDEREAELFPSLVRLAEGRCSDASNIGDGSKEFSVLEPWCWAYNTSASICDSHSNSSRVLNFPP